MNHLVQIDDHSDQEDHQESSREVIVSFSKEPEEDTEDQKDIERFDDLEDQQFNNSRFMDDHGPRSICILQMMRICLAITLLLTILLGENPDPFLIIIKTQLDNLPSLYDISHVPINKTKSIDLTILL